MASLEFDLSSTSQPRRARTKPPTLWKRLAVGFTHLQTVLQSKSKQSGWVLSVTIHLIIAMILALCVAGERATELFETVITSLGSDGTGDGLSDLDTTLSTDVAIDLQPDLGPQSVAEHVDSVGGFMTNELADTGIGRPAGTGTGGGAGDGVGAGIAADIDRMVGGRGGAVSRNMRASLVWQNRNDIDLRLRFTSTIAKNRSERDEEVTFRAMQSPSGFELDVDSNAGTPMHNPGVENIVLKSGRPPDGHYVIDANYFSNHFPEPFVTDCRLYFVSGKTEIMVYAKFAKLDQWITMVTFDVKKGEVVNLKRGPATFASQKTRPKNELEAERLLVEAKQCIEDSFQSDGERSKKKADEAKGILKRITTEFKETPSANEARKLAKRLYND